MDRVNFIYPHHPWGPVYGLFTEVGLRRLDLPMNGLIFVDPAPLPKKAATTLLHEALELYFNGIPVSFSEIPLDLTGATPFRRAVWEAARGVRWGHTTTYSELARQTGNTAARRAVGQALGANPIPILIPCHRILASGGALGGFACGLRWKRELLRLERQELAVE